jgi:two-component system alkaline phosphatase synthesis response regulator PhoP
MKKILIVEDDERIGMALAIRLRAAGYETLLARDGQKGLQLARNCWPDLVLLDIGLPLMDIWMPLGVGYSVARRLKSIGRGSIPIIFITASKESGLREAAQKIGAAGFFEKPYNPDELLKAIEEILNHGASGREVQDCAHGSLQTHQPGQRSVPKNSENHEANTPNRRR